jgi:iron complex transport system substrate-binding protein
VPLRIGVGRRLGRDIPITSPYTDLRRGFKQVHGGCAERKVFERVCVIVAHTAPSLRILGGVAAAFWLAIFPGTPAAQASGFELRDDLKHEVTFARYPQRIVSLLPSLTETVCALGACDRLVATDRYSDWPPQVRALPKAGGIDDAEVELIVSLKPDLILLSRSQRITDRLQNLGLVCFALNTDSYPEIAHTVRIIGEILGLNDQASHLNETISRAVREVGEQAAARRHGNGPTVYFEVDGPPYAAGPSSFIGELLERLGARNIVTADLGPFPQLNPEYVVRHDPDVIFVTPSEAAHLTERPGWDRIRAVKEHRVCSFASAVRDSIVRPGPRVADGMRAMADCLAKVSP